MDEEMEEGGGGFGLYQEDTEQKKGDKKVI